MKESQTKMPTYADKFPQCMFPFTQVHGRQDKRAPWTGKVSRGMPVILGPIYAEPRLTSRSKGPSTPVQCTNTPVRLSHFLTSSSFHTSPTLSPFPAVWMGLEALGFGANLQHYNPLIDERIAQEYKLPYTWNLKSQLVFGTPTGGPMEKTFKPVEERVKVFGTDAALKGSA